MTQAVEGPQGLVEATGRRLEGPDLVVRSRGLEQEPWTGEWVLLDGCS
ncbi:MAG TPA: hypothetical protein VFL46_02640 [Phycicoccus sp.]|nr:hypothetical protein [Phycicoccus sp.]